MKRSILDITQKISRNPGHTPMTPYDLNDSTYWIFQAKGWRFVSLLREIEYRNSQDRISIYVNTLAISNRDFLVEQKTDGILVKFIKDNFEYSLDDDDYVEIKGDIEQYA